MENKQKIKTKSISCSGVVRAVSVTAWRSLTHTAQFVCTRINAAERWSKMNMEGKNASDILVSCEFGSSESKRARKLISYFEVVYTPYLHTNTGTCSATSMSYDVHDVQGDDTIALAASFSDLNPSYEERLSVMTEELFFTLGKTNHYQFVVAYLHYTACLIQPSLCEYMNSTGHSFVHSTGRLLVHCT